MNNRIKNIKLMNKKGSDDKYILKSYKCYLKKENLTNAKCSKVQIKQMTKKKQKQMNKNIKNKKVNIYNVYYGY